MTAWGVEFHSGGDGGPSVVDQADVCCVHGSGWLFCRSCIAGLVVRPFAWFCARSGFWDACGADGKLPGRCCATSV